MPDKGHDFLSKIFISLVEERWKHSYAAYKIAYLISKFLSQK